MLIVGVLFNPGDKPKFVSAPVSTVAEPGKPVCLTVQIKDATEVKWLKNEKEIRPSRDYKIEKDRDDKTIQMLKIPNFADSHVALYTCQALNENGVVKASAFVVEKGIYTIAASLNLLQNVAF